MYLPEDRHPLLYVYLDDDDQPERIRSRCVSQGATTVLGKWPEHLTFSWMMGVIGLISLLTCFLLAIVFLLASSSGHHVRKSLSLKCERNEHVVQLVHMKNLEDLTVNENATYFVEVITNETQKKDTACSIESYLKRTTLPVFLVTIYTNKSLQNLAICNELQKKFNNFKIISFDLHSFFNKTVFTNFQSQNVKFLTFLAKVLVSWNVGGTVIDSQLKTLKDFQSILRADEKTLTIGKVEEDVLLISAKRFCHVYIFDILKTITETKDILQYTDVDIVKATQKRFCHGRWNCTAVKLLSTPEFCNSGNVNSDCTFILTKPNKTQFPSSVNLTWEKLCPVTKALTL